MLEGMRKDHDQSDHHWNWFRDYTGETSQWWDWVHMDFPEHVNTILNWTELCTGPLPLDLDCSTIWTPPWGPLHSDLSWSTSWIIVPSGTSRTIWVKITFFFSFLKKQTNPQYPQPVGAGCAFFQAMIKGKPSFWGKPLIVFIIIIWLCVQSWVRRSTLKWCPASCLRAYYGRFSFVLFVYSSRFCFRWIHVDSCACLLQHCV